MIEGNVAVRSEVAVSIRPTPRPREGPALWRARACHLPRPLLGQHNEGASILRARGFALTELGERQQFEPASALCSSLFRRAGSMQWRHRARRVRARSRPR